MTEKHISQEKLKANQQNAKQSTGPRTDEGKQSSAKNAIKHGLLAKQAVLSDENLPDHLPPEAARHHGEDSDLRRWGLRLAERGGKSAKRKAIVAVARKLAVLLHVLWKRDTDFDPFYGTGDAQQLPKNRRSGGRNEGSEALLQMEEGTGA